MEWSEAVACLDANLLDAKEKEGEGERRRDCPSAVESDRQRQAVSGSSSPAGSRRQQLAHSKRHDVLVTQWFQESPIAPQRPKGSSSMKEVRKRAVCRV